MRPARERDWLAIALAGALGALAGVLIALALGGGSSTDIRTITVKPKPPPDATLVAKTAVPNAVGMRLDIAKDTVQRAGFTVKVEGGGVLGVIRERNWMVTSQDPVAGQLLQVGSTVHLRIERG
jgi:hypothetical protein